MGSSNVADGLKIEDLANTSQIVERTEAVDGTDDIRLDKAFDLQVSSSEQEEVPEDKESSKVSTGVVLIQAAVMGDDRIAEHNDNINKEGDNPENASIVSRKRSLVETELDARSENSVLQKLPRAPRYFDPPDCSLPACKRFKNGNRKRKHKKKRKLCYICATLGHDGKSCNQVNNCSICSKKENENNVEEDNTSILCLKCGSAGHDLFSCSNDYNPEDLKNIQCYLCKDFGHLCCIGNKIEGPSQASCYNCGESSHYGFECTKSNEVANDLQSVSLCSKCKERDNKATSADAMADKSAKGKSRKSRRGGRKRKRKSTLTTNATQSWPSIAMRGYRMPAFGQYYGKPGSNIWLSPTTAAARKSLNNSAALNQSSYQHMLPSSNYHSGGLTHQTFFNPRMLFPHEIYSQHLNHQTGVHLSNHNINQQVGTQVPPNSFDPRTLPPGEIFYQGTQIPGQPQSKVQLPHQNFSHGMGTQVPQSTIDNQTQILSYQIGTHVSEKPELPLHVSNDKINALLHEILQHQIQAHSTIVNSSEKNVECLVLKPSASGIEDSEETKGRQEET